MTTKKASKAQNQLKLDGLFDRQIGRRGALEYLVHVNCSAAVLVEPIGSIRHQSPIIYEVSEAVHRGNLLRRNQRHNLRAIAPQQGIVKHNEGRSTAKSRAQALGNLGDAGAVGIVPVGPCAIPIEQKIVIRPTRQDVDVDMGHRLPGKLTVRLHQADSSWLQRIVDGTRDFRHRSCHCRKCVRRHVQHRFEMQFWNHEAVSIVSWMNVHE